MKFAPTIGRRPWPAPLGVMVLLSAVAPAHGEPVRAPAGAKEPAAVLEVPTHRGVEPFIADAPDGRWTAARRVNADRADKSGRVPPPMPGYVLTSTVVVQAADIGPSMETIQAAGAKASPVEGVPGFWRVEAPSVRAAAALAAALRAEGRVERAHVDIGTPQPLRDPPPTDPGFPLQWHLNNTVTPIADLNVVPAWAAGYTGAGITVGVVEDGFVTTHPDLAANYNAAASMSGTGYTSHGTSVAGLVAAAANNGLGGAGVAYGGRVSKIYRGFTALDHATAFTFLNNLNQVKTHSWGPPDNGMVTTLAPEEAAALAQSAATGRGGLGTVVCWAAGNGGTGDRCDYDPFVSSRYTIAVGSINEFDVRSYYNETGSSMFVVAPSSGTAGTDRGIYTTSGTSGYTESFGGTSASSPEAAGVVALMLQANPALTWRDVKHVLARTARRCQPASPGWTVNGGGRPVSYDYGFGAIDAGAAVALARTWPNVPAETVVASGLRSVGLAIPDNNATGVSQSYFVTANIAVESVEVVVNVTHAYIGDLRITLTSPSGTSSVLATPRLDGADNYADYVFTTERHWDERSVGTWTLRISDEMAPDAGVWNSWQLKVYGSPLCRADWDHNGAVDPADVAAYVQHWVADLSSGGAVANLDADPAVTPADLSLFVNTWFQAISGGC